MKKTFIFLLFLPAILFSQGCSDAGFCTLSNMKGVQSDSISYKSYVRLGFNLGSADNDVTALGSYIEYGNSLTDVFSLSLKLGYMSQSSGTYSSSSFSDIYVNGTYKLNSKWNVNAGFKIPLTDGNKMDDGQPLPMDFQPSLGTFDFIAGVKGQWQNFSAIVAMQQPLTQNNNTFLAPVGSPFFSTNQFKRSGDVLMRLSYQITVSDKLKISASALPIYHLVDDKYTDLSGNEQRIEGSSGLTLNGNLFVIYQLNAKNALELSVGAPFVVREARPDGLTRSSVVNLDYKISF